MKFFFSKEMTGEFIKNKLNYDLNSHILKSNKKIAKYADIKQTKCFVCGSRNSKIDCTIFSIDYLICKNCSHAFVNKRLSDKSLSKYYRKNTNYSSINYANKKLMKMRDNISIPKINFIKKFTKGKKWLDVGSADGSIVTICKKKGFDVTGIELSEYSRKFAKMYRNIDLYPNSLEEFYESSSSKWDVISLFGVLEHLPEPMKILKICHAMLKKNGVIAIDVPNYNSISSHVQKLTRNPSRHLVPHTHIMLFTIQSIELALKNSGFKPLSTWMWGMDIIEFLKYISKLDKNFLKSQLGLTLISSANEIQKIFDQKKLGDDFMMIARKK